MPRLTNHTYLAQCHELQVAWRNEETRIFFLLSASEQWSLQAFCLPSESLSDQILLDHRQDITALCPSLPQRAGRALARLRIMERRLEDYRAAPKPVRKKGADYKIRILSEGNPVIDPKQIAKILLNYEPRD